MKVIDEKYILGDKDNWDILDTIHDDKLFFRSLKKVNIKV